MIAYLHYEVRSWLERKGLEEDAMSHRDGNLYIEVDDVDEAFELRSMMLDYYPCQLISHPEKGTPVLEVFELMPNLAGLMLYENNSRNL